MYFEAFSAHCGAVVCSRLNRLLTESHESSTIYLVDNAVRGGDGEQYL
ncbi:hypothetical protein GE061_004430, partial [Apolygus lucorum]